jgi:c-di-GMP-binding flagellar brake protein YcgR
MLLVILCAVVAVVATVWLILGGGAKSPESRRAAARVQVVVPVEVECFGERYKANSQNISGGGMLLKSEAPVKVAQPLQLTFVLPENIAIHVPAVVCHKRGPLFGVRFDPTYPRRGLIEKWVLRAVEEDHRRAARAEVATQ